MVYRTLLFSFKPAQNLSSNYVYNVVDYYLAPQQKFRENGTAGVPKAKPCGILLVDFKREILREWLGREKTCHLKPRILNFLVISR
jgi:hypothetical protein